MSRQPTERSGGAPSGDHPSRREEQAASSRPADTPRESADRTHYHFLLEFCHTHPGSHEHKAPHWRQEVVYEWRADRALPGKDLPDDFARFLETRELFGVKMGLSNMKRLLGALGLDRGVPPVLIVGGTNGKGTVATALGDALAVAGYRPGVYTSPHVERFLERIQVSGSDPDDRALGAACDEVREATMRLDEEGVHATFFEVSTALALAVFRRQEAHPLVLEVGLGGRLDAVNALEPAVSVITNVGSDHAEHLGATLASRVHEKAGILRPGRPCFTAAQGEALTLLRQEALQMGAPLVPVLPEAPAASIGDAALALVRTVLTDPAVRRTLPRLSRLDPSAIHLPHLPGRQESLWLPNGVEVLLDVAHNAEALAALGARLDTHPVAPDQRVLVAGLLREKPAEAVADLARGRFAAVHIGRPVSPRARDAASLAEALRGAGVPVASAHEDPVEALRAALAETPAEGLLVVTGSFYLLSALRPVVRGLARGG